MVTRTKWWKQFIVAALCSALASLMIVAVGPGFSKSNNASDKASDKGEAASASSNASENSSSNAGGNKDVGTTAAGGGSSSDNDGDADSDPGTALEDDHTTADPGDNAHPSGKDRSVENGKSGNQGKSESNPDDSKGPQRFEGGRGDDKPQGPGGTDRDDQDGNNGCGNDDDFDDDNNGHCGKPSEPTTPPSGGGGDKPVCPAGTAKAGQPMPAGDVSKCDTGNVKPGGSGGEVCPAGTDMAGKEIPKPQDSSWCTKDEIKGGNGGNGGNGGPDGKITICHRTGSETNPWVVITVSVNAWDAHQKHGDLIHNGDSCEEAAVSPNNCPVGTDYAGLPMPDGTVESCNGDDSTPGGPTCPKGTDMAGLPIPVGGIAACDDDVLADIIDKDGGDDPDPSGPGDDVAGASERKGGRALPFTGASITAYVLLALQMIGAGALITRARRKKT